MPEKQTFTYYLTVEVEAVSDDSALNKLSNWIEPTLALKKNADLECTSIEYDDEAGGATEAPEEEPEEVEEVEKPKKTKAKKNRPEIKMPEKDDFDYDNIPDWDELEDDEEPPKEDEEEEDEDDLDQLLSGLEDDEEESDDEDSEDDDDDDWDWDDDDEEW